MNSTNLASVCLRLLIVEALPQHDIPVHSLRRSSGDTT